MKRYEKDGFEHVYNDDNKLIYQRDLKTGYEQIFVYDQHGNRVFSKNNKQKIWSDWELTDNGFQVKHHKANKRGIWQDYNIKSIYAYDSSVDVDIEYDENGFEQVYDIKGRLIYQRNPKDGYEWIWVYDEYDNEIFYRTSRRPQEEWYKEKEINGEFYTINRITRKGKEWTEEWWDFDENGNEIHYRDNTCYEHWIEYNKHGKEIHFKDNNGYEYYTYYNMKGRKKIVHVNKI